MRIFHVSGDRFVELDERPAELPAEGFLWIGSARREFEIAAPELQSALQRWTGSALVDLHVSDLLNNQLPSHFDTTSWYDLMVFRRLAAGPGAAQLFVDGEHGTLAAARRALDSIDTSPADLMLRMVNHMVDNYLDLRRLLTRQLSYLQQELLDPKSRFRDWQVLLESRNALHLLEDTCEDQRSAVQEWIDALDEWPEEADPHARRERELLRVRSRDVLEHVERVLSHVRRLGESAETAVQMHFSALGHRTNDIMRTLTVLTAIFLPLNLVTGFFGMNFDSLPLIHSSTGAWIAIVGMLLLGIGLVTFFWRKRYLGGH